MAMNHQRDGWLLMVGMAGALTGCGPKTGGGSAVAPLDPVQACLQSTDPASGIDACKTALASNPDNGPLHRRMGLLRLKSGSLKAARQAYQVAFQEDSRDSEAQFGLGLTLEAIGEPDANKQKLQAAERSPAVIDTFRKYGFAEPDLLTFDTAPRLTKVVNPEHASPYVPKIALDRDLGVDVKCLVSAAGALHDCKAITPLAPSQADFGPAAVKIVSLCKVEPAKNKGAPVNDAPILISYVFAKTSA
jgi:hypothetical protein